VEGQAGLSQASGAVGTSPNAIDSTHFLWYTGHWSKTKKNVFIVDANGASKTGGSGSPGGGSSEDPAGSGGTITIDDDGSVHTSAGNVDEWNKWVDQAQKTADQTVQILNNPADNMDPATHKLYAMMKADADSQQQQIARLKIKPTEDLLSGDQNDVPLRNDQISDYCQQAKANYDEVINFYKNHVNDKDDALKVTKPPEFDYDCIVCDSNLYKENQNRIEKYVDDFVQPDKDIIHKGFAILHKLAISGFLANGPGLNKFDGCSYLDIEALSKASRWIAAYSYRRAEKLVKDYKSNSKVVESVFRVYTVLDRQWELLGGKPDSKLGDIGQMFGNAADDILKKMVHDDWREIGNVPLLLTQARMAAMLDNHDDARYLNELQSVYNGFELSIEMDIKVGDKDAYKLAHLKGKCHIIPEFTGDKDQCYTWVVAQEMDFNGFGLFPKKRMQTIDCQVVANELITPPQAPRIIYKGTKAYTAELKGLRMDFCHPGHDTIFLTGFTPNPADAGVWAIPLAGLQNLGVNGMEEFFKRIDEEKEESQSGDAVQLVKQFEQKERELQAQMKAIQDAQAAATAAKANGQSSQEKILELSDQSKSLSTNPGLAKVLYLDFLLPVQNNNSILTDKKYFAKEINPDNTSAVIYGTYTIHIENNANGKTKPLQPPK
jgi:hypothetical protein